MAKFSNSIIEFEGTVLKTFPYSDSHLILRVLSPTAGKISLIAKSARASKKRFPGSFDYFDSGKFRVRSGRSSSEALGEIVEFVPQRSFGELRNDLDRLITGSVVCEAYDVMLAEASPEAKDCYELLILGLEAISRSENLKDSLKGCFLSLANLLKKEGLLKDEQLIPSSNNLLTLIRLIEEHCNKELRTKPSVRELVGALKSRTI